MFKISLADSRDSITFPPNPTEVAESMMFLVFLKMTTKCTYSPKVIAINSVNFGGNNFFQLVMPNHFRFYREFNT